MSYLVGNRIRLAKFTDRHITAKYLDWLNDHDINRYMFTGRMPVSKDEVKDRNDFCNIVFSIISNLVYDEEKDQLIQTDMFSEFVGTISLDGIDWINKKAELAYMIGEQSHWGVGLATEAVSLVSEYAFNRLNLHKLEAGVIDGNDGSIRVLEKNGFKKYATVPEDYWLEGKFLNVERFYKLQ